MVKKIVIIAFCLMAVIVIAVIGFGVLIANIPFQDDHPSMIRRLNGYDDDPRYVGYIESYFATDQPISSTNDQYAAFVEAITETRKRIREKKQHGDRPLYPLQIISDNDRYIAIVLDIAYADSYKSGIVLSIKDFLDEKQDPMTMIKAAELVDPAIEKDAANTSSPMYSQRWLVIEKHMAQREAEKKK